MTIFIQDLHPIADKCEYGQLNEELIRDHIVVMVIDHAFSEELQAKANLTFAEAVQLSQQTEARKES